jgi:hypothetical protein
VLKRNVHNWLRGQGYNIPDPTLDVMLHANGKTGGAFSSASSNELPMTMEDLTEELRAQNYKFLLVSPDEMDRRTRAMAS